MTFNRGMTRSAVLTRHSGGVLIASPSTFLREQVLHSLPPAHRPVQQASSGADALVKLENGEWQVLFLDRRLPDLDPEELIGIIRQRFPKIEVVVLDSDSGQPLHLTRLAGGEPRRCYETSQKSWQETEYFPLCVGSLERCTAYAARAFRSCLPPSTFNIRFRL
jgi:CheY-like chemotaxis protein